VATQKQTGCCGGPSCCGPTEAPSSRPGYSDEDQSSLPDGADLGLGCGNPQAIAAPKPGERGPTGFVIGVDMTPEMVDRARTNAAKTGLSHVASVLVTSNSFR
jgi:methylase of polypeptide subunit release factors